jgi:hypothetical protein
VKEREQLDELLDAEEIINLSDLNLNGLINELSAKTKDDEPRERTRYKNQFDKRKRGKK